MRKSDFRIRVSDILQTSGQPHTEIFEIRREFRYKGLYIDFWVEVKLCRRYDLRELERDLRSWKPEKEPAKEPVKKPAKEPAKKPAKEPTKEPAKEPELSEFIEIADFPSPVIIRKSDFRINASHIAKLNDRSKHTVRDLRK